jgi:sugar phosphate isomerase/epimerase
MIIFSHLDNRSPVPEHAGMTDVRLSCVDSAFPKLSHPAALAVIKDLGIPAVDVCVFAGYDHTQLDRVIDDPEGEADVVRRRLDDLDLEVADAFAILGASTFEDLAINHPEEEVRRDSMHCFGQLLRFARRLGASGLTILPGTTFDGIDESQSLELAAAELRARAELAAAVNVPLSVEPHFGSIVQTPASTLRLVELAPEVGLTLDYSHYVYQGIEPDAVDALLPYTRHFHVRPAAPGAIQARADEGTIDFVRIRDELVARGYSGWFALEYQWEEPWEPGAMDFTRVDCISETIAIRDLLRGPSESG